jgi:plastocyanin
MVAVIACGGGGEAPTAEAPAGGAATAPAGGEMIDPATIADAGAVTGTVQFAGTDPEVQVIQMAADPYCLSSHSGEVTAQRVMVNANGTLAQIFVYVKEGLEGKTFPVPTEKVTLDQHGCMYVPHIIGVQTGQTLVVHNSDDTLHNVNAQPSNNPGFNIGQPMAGMEYEHTFENPEIMIPVKCDVHPWMAAFIGVLPHPYFAVTDAEGGFSIDHLPPGDYVLEAWSEGLGTQTINVTVAPNETAEASFTFGG